MLVWGGFCFSNFWICQVPNEIWILEALSNHRLLGGTCYHLRIWTAPKRCEHAHTWDLGRLMVKYSTSKLHVPGIMALHVDIATLLEHRALHISHRLYYIGRRRSSERRTSFPSSRRASCYSWHSIRQESDHSLLDIKQTRQRGQITVFPCVSSLVRYI